MGCTSGKEMKKKTVSVEDLKSVEAPQVNATPSKNKNGQINTPVKREKDPSTTVIEIPGQHKSFLAPDGIPFIDEDSDTEEPPSSPVAVVANAKSPSSPSGDQNKNILSNNVTTPTRSHQQQQQQATESSVKSSVGALPSTVGPAGVSASVDPVESHHVSLSLSAAPGDGGAGEEERPAVIGEILEREMMHTTDHRAEAPAAISETSQHVADSTEDEFHTTPYNTPHSPASPPRGQEEVAATKIQAGIRGYLDRKKVKEIRAHKQTPGLSVAVSDDDQRKLDDSSVTYDDEKYDEAAVKIQAGFKGYKTRKEVKAMKESHTPAEEVVVLGGDDEVLGGEVVGGEVEVLDGKDDRHILTDEHGRSSPEYKLDADDPKLNLAATKIQANYKGYKTRKVMNKTHK